MCVCKREGERGDGDGRMDGVGIGDWQSNDRRDNNEINRASSDHALFGARRTSRRHTPVACTTDNAK